MTRSASLHRKASPARLWLTLFALIAFTFQAYLSQSHVHAAPIVAGKQLPGKLPPKLPGGDDQANCPVCQAALHGGHYLAPGASGFVPLVLMAHGAFTPTHVASAVESASHSWTSRGPPLI